MDKTHAERDARALIAMHGLDPALFKWNRGKSMMGQMHATRDRYTGAITLVSISLSSYWVEAMTVEEVREVMLHEIAHALTPGDGHNWRFRAKVSELGGVARHGCYAPSKETVARMDALAPAPWVGVCPSCGTERKMHRAPTAVKACSKCCRGRFNMAFVFYYKHKGRTVPPSAMPAKYYNSWKASSNRHAAQAIAAALKN